LSWPGRRVFGRVDAIKHRVLRFRHGCAVIARAFEMISIWTKDTNGNCGRRGLPVLKGTSDRLTCKLYDIISFPEDSHSPFRTAAHRIPRVRSH
jgi:hypothetical protein